MVCQVSGPIQPSPSPQANFVRWDPVHGGKGDAEIPPNFSPGVIPVLAKILQRSSAKGISRSAVLSRDAVHIKTSFPFDISKLKANMALMVRGR